MTKTQKKRMLNSVRKKSFVLFGEGIMSMQDYDKIITITKKGLNKLK